MSAPRTEPATSPPVALVTLGRLPVALEVARALRSLGYRVLIAEPLGVYPARMSRAVWGHRSVRAPQHDPDGYLKDLLDIVSRDGVSLVVPVSEETPHVARLHARLPTTLLRCSAHDTVLQLHDKARFAQLCERLDVAAPQTVPAREAAALCAHSDWVCKPRLSCSGRDVVFGAAGSVPTLPNAALDDVIVQRRIAGDALCSCSVVRDGAVIATAVYRPLLHSGSVAVRFRSVPIPARVADTIGRIAAATGATGFLSFDFLEDAQHGWQVIECNPRATSGVHLFAPEVLRDALRALCSDAPSGAPVVQATPGTERQEFWSALLKVQGEWLQRRGERGAWRALFGVRDITWHARDPLPFLLMTPASAPLLWRAFRARRPITEVTTQDIGWYR